MFAPFARRLFWGAALVLSCSLPGLADEPSGGTVSGTVLSLDGAAIAGARVALDGPSHVVALSAPDGRFSIAAVVPGRYAASVSALRFARPALVTLDVRAGAVTSLSFRLARSNSALHSIGTVTASNVVPLSNTPASVTALNPQDLADQGATRVSDVLQEDDGATVAHPAGGGNSVLPTSVSLRGPDPSDTQIDIDGHQVNNGNTGDFDLSLLDPADFSTIELIRGLSSASFVGPDSIDGAINLHTIEPTVEPHGLLRLNLGTFSSLGGTLQSTGTLDGRFGYVLSLHQQGSAGEVNERVFNLETGTIQRVGSGSQGTSELGKLRYAFGNAGSGYAELSFHDQGSYRDLSAALSAYSGSVSGAASEAASTDLGGVVTRPPAGVPAVLSYAGTALQTHNAGYGLDVSLPLGALNATGIADTTLLLRHYTSLVDQSVAGPGAEISPYLYNDRDVLDEETLQLDHRMGNAALTLQYIVRNESLNTDFVPGQADGQSMGGVAPEGLRAATELQRLDLGQTQRSLSLRYAYNPTRELHFTAAGYYSDLSLFGTHLDPRFGFAWTPDTRSTLRLSLGTTYTSPQLPELVVPNPLPAVSGGYISIGNPDLKPEHATEYDLGFDRVLYAGSGQTEFSADLYRVNLRTPVSTLLPALDPKCGPASAAGDGSPCPLSYPVNAGDGVYQGLELSARHHFGKYATLRLAYAVHSSYLSAIPAYVQDGTLVLGEQTLGLPLHKGSLTLASAPPRGLIYGASVVYEGAYNELNQPPFGTLDARLGYRFPNGYEVGLAGTNLTNVYDQRFTRTGLGVPYGGYDQVVATDAYALQGTAFALTLTRRF